MEVVQLEPQAISHRYAYLRGSWWGQHLVSAIKSQQSMSTSLTTTWTTPTMLSKYFWSSPKWCKSQGSNLLSTTAPATGPLMCEGGCIAVWKWKAGNAPAPSNGQNVQQAFLKRHQRTTLPMIWWSKTKPQRTNQVALHLHLYHCVIARKCPVVK